jgi:hypothetical protein
MNKLLLGGGVLVTLLLVGRRAAAATMPSPFADPLDRDLDALADMLITETSFKANRNEMAQIVWIAYNRAKRQGRPMWFVVQPGTGPSPVWNTGPLYRQLFQNARGKPLWAEARAFAESVLGGAYPNLGKTSFVHPKPMPTPPCASNRVATSTQYGVRCLPAWILAGTPVGSAWFA